MYDAEFPEAYTHKLRKARKEHKCNECFGLIKKGENYHYHSGIWDHEPADFKICLDCESLRSDINKTIKDWDDKIPFSCLFEFVSACNEPDWIVRFVASMIKREARVPDWLIKKYNEAKLDIVGRTV